MLSRVDILIRSSPKVSLLGKSIVRAGLMGSAALSSAVKLQQEKSTDGSPFTVIGSKEAYTLAA